MLPPIMNARPPNIVCSVSPVSPTTTSRTRSASSSSYAMGRVSQSVAGPRRSLRAEPASVVERDERGLATHLQLLHCPGVAVRVAEAEERAAVTLVEDLDLARFHTATDELGAGRLGVRDDQLQ